MRVLSSKVKRSMLLFGVVVLGCLGAVGACVGKVVATQSDLYTIASGSTVFDNAYNQVEVSAEASVSRSWDKLYTLAVNSDKKTLGKQTVVYEPTSSAVKIFGSGYRLYPDGTVSMLDNYTQVSNLNETGFFKLSDRKYLITGSRIWDNVGLVDTSNYLFISLDDAGNARLLNDTMNVVAVEEGMTLYSDGLEFVLSSQTATIGDHQIDLTSILGGIAGLGEGSSSKTGTGGEVYDITVRGGNGGNGGTGGTGGTGGIGGMGGTGGSGGTGGTGGTGGIGGIGGTGGTGVSGGTGGITAAGRTYMVLKSVSSDAMSLDISYQIADPFGNYGVGYLLVYDAAAGLGNYNDTQAYTMPISLDDTSIHITEYTSGMSQDENGNLVPVKSAIQPNKQYTIEIGYYSSEDENAPYKYIDIMRANTVNVTSSLKVTQLELQNINAQIGLDTDTAMNSVWVKVIQEDDSGNSEEAVQQLSGNEISAAKNGNLGLSLSLAGLFEDETYQTLKNDMTTITLELWVKYSDSDSSTYGSRLNRYSTSNPYTTGSAGYAAFLSLADEEDAVDGEAVVSIRSSLEQVLNQVTALSEAQSATKTQLEALNGTTSADSSTDTAAATTDKSEQVKALEQQLSEQQAQNQQLMDQLKALQEKLDSLSAKSDSAKDDSPKNDSNNSSQDTTSTDDNAGTGAGQNTTSTDGSADKAGTDAVTAPEGASAATGTDTAAGTQ